jgi:hypothetical protein
MTLSIAEARALTVAGGNGTAALAPLSAALATFEPITLCEMAQSALMDRAELKYVLPLGLLPFVLAELRHTYRVLTVSGRRQGRYRTLYFDTPELALYLRHHAGAPDRYKIRSREYIDSQAAFFEVKHRLPNHRTQKRRIATAGLLASPVAAFLTETSPYTADDLCPTLWNTYTRATLVSRTRAERVTLDLNVEYTWEGESLPLSGIVIAEVKYDASSGPGAAWASPFVMAMRRRNLRSTAFSKYCIGLSLLSPALKHNKFKPEHLAIERTMDIQRSIDIERTLSVEKLMQGGEDGHR